MNIFKVNEEIGLGVLSLVLSIVSNTMPFTCTVHKHICHR